jgi:hypothetical protein
MTLGCDVPNENAVYCLLLGGTGMATNGFGMTPDLTFQTPFVMYAS